MRETGNVLFIIGVTLFILGSCGYDGQPVLCGMMVLAGLGIAYLGYRKGEKINAEAGDNERTKDGDVLDEAGRVLLSGNRR